MLSPVPTGTVDFITSAWRSEAGMAPTTACTRGEVGVAGVGRWRADGDEEQPRVLQRRPELGREVQPLAMLGDQLLQPGLPDRDPTLAQAADLLGVDVDAVDVGAQRGDPAAVTRADIAGADHADRLSLRSQRS